MNSFKTAIAAGLILASGFAAVASAQTVSGGRQGARGRGYSYSYTRSGGTVTGSVQTNKGYGATGTHTGGYNAYGARYGSSSVITNNGSTVNTHSTYTHGVAAGSATVTGPGGQTVQGGGAVYVPN